MVKEIFNNCEEALLKYPIVPKQNWGSTTKDLTNQKFGKLTCLYRVKKGTGVKWLCQCECGNYTIVQSTNLLSGNSKSCGCVGIEKSKITIQKATQKALEATTEQLISGQIFGPAGVRYFGPSDEKDYRNSRKDYFICPLCGEKFLSIRANIKNGHTKSCGCSYNSKTSLGEQLIISILEKENIKFMREKSFEDVPKTRRCRYDFYLPDLNILLEYNGEQHYVYTPYFYKNLSEFKHRQELDRLKISAALAMNIPLYCIPYWEADNLLTAKDLFQDKFLAHSKFHNDEVWRMQKTGQSI